MLMLYYVQSPKIKKTVLKKNQNVSNILLERDAKLIIIMLFNGNKVRKSKIIDL